MKRGICYLIGAGPGDPGLLTVKGRECLERADVVVYDHLCNPALAGIAPPAAERIFAGKQPGRQLMTQEKINALLVEKVRQGLVVARLKGGDPFLFGRGGEEAAELAAAGVDFEVVPGVTSAIAGPAYAGIPVTHRDHNSVLTIFTGHEDPEKKHSKVDYAALAAAPGTKILLMGMERLAEITAALLRHGMAAATPCALIRWATTGRQQCLTGRLDDIAEKAASVGFSAPAVAVFGEVVGLRAKLNWHETKPLFGKRIAVTRTREGAGGLVRRLAALGADAFELPVIRIAPPADPKALIEAAAHAHHYDWVVFTSPNGVNAFFEAFFSVYRDAREFGSPRIAAIGPSTAERVNHFRFAVDLRPEKAVAEALLEKLLAEGSPENLKFLMVRPEDARDVIAAELTRRGAIVDEAIAYRTLAEQDDAAGGIRRFRADGADIITFTSSSTVRHFKALDLALPQGIRTASIGPITSQTMHEAGFPVDIEAREHHIDGLVGAISEDCKKPAQPGT